MSHFWFFLSVDGETNHCVQKLHGLLFFFFQCVYYIYFKYGWIHLFSFELSFTAPSIWLIPYYIFFNV